LRVNSVDFAAWGTCPVWGNIGIAAATVSTRVIQPLTDSTYSLSASRSATSARTERARAQRESISSRETILPRHRACLCRDATMTRPHSTTSPSRSNAWSPALRKGATSLAPRNDAASPITRWAMRSWLRAYRASILCIRHQSFRVALGRWAIHHATPYGGSLSAGAPRPRKPHRCADGWTLPQKR